jgi:hypothetical protein
LSASACLATSAVLGAARDAAAGALAVESDCGTGDDSTGRDSEGVAAPASSEGRALLGAASVRAGAFDSARCAVLRDPARCLAVSTRESLDDCTGGGTGLESLGIRLIKIVQTTPAANAPMTFGQNSRRGGGAEKIREGCEGPSNIEDIGASYEVAVSSLRSCAC